VVLDYTLWYYLSKNVNIDNARLLAIAKDKGKIELVIVDSGMKTAKAIAKRKFAGWREEDHEADSLAVKLLKR
jgi:hypothetical protein